MRSESLEEGRDLRFRQPVYDKDDAGPSVRARPMRKRLRRMQKVSDPVNCGRARLAREIEQSLDAKNSFAVSLHKARDCPPNLTQMQRLFEPKTKGTNAVIVVMIVVIVAFEVRTHPPYGARDGVQKPADVHRTVGRHNEGADGLITASRSRSRGTAYGDAMSDFVRTSRSARAICLADTRCLSSASNPCSASTTQTMPSRRKSVASSGASSNSSQSGRDRQGRSFR